MVSCMSQAFAALPFLEGTVWRYTEGKKSFTTMKFTSGSGGYFIFNNYERKFIFTYYYNDGVGTIYRDRDEFRNVKDATRLASAKFLIDHDTLIYDGREFIRMREMENREEIAEAERQHNGVRQVDDEGQHSGSIVKDYTWTGQPAYEEASQPPRQPVQQNVPPQQYAPRSVPSSYTSGNANGNTVGGVKRREAATSSQGRNEQGQPAELRGSQPSTQQRQNATPQNTDAYCNNASSPSDRKHSSQQTSQCSHEAPTSFAQASDISGFEDRYVEGAMPMAAYNGEDEGRNVLRIWVDRDGTVTRAEPNQTGSTLTSAYYVKRAQLVASRLKLTAKKNAPRTQTGFLTVTFLKKK